MSATLDVSKVDIFGEIGTTDPVAVVSKVNIFAEAGTTDPNTVVSKVTIYAECAPDAAARRKVSVSVFTGKTYRIGA